MLKQCKACPWKKSTSARADIPDGYCRDMHEDLRSTISDGRHVPGAQLRLMACHETPIGRERICAGWAANQLGDGNNIALRLRALSDPNLVDIVLDGEQHETFEDTLT